MRSIIRKLLIDSPQWLGFLLVGPAAGFVLAGFFIIVWSVPSLAGSAAAHPGTGIGAISIFFFAMALGLILGILWGLSSSVGAVATWLLAGKLTRTLGSHVVLVACGAAGGAVAFGLFVVVPVTGWNPIDLCVPVAALAAGGFGLLTVVRARADSIFQPVIEASKDD